MPRIMATIKKAYLDLSEVHKPDNGLTASSLEL
jgi:hypothetical protein